MKLKHVLCGLLYVALVSSGLCATERTSDERGKGDVLRETGRAFSSIAKRAIPAVVSVRVEKVRRERGGSQQYYYNDPFNFFGDEFMRRFFGDRMGPDRQPRQFKQMGQGSGFLISEDGEILTNNHVVGDADRIVVRLHDGREFDAELVGTDPKSEVAVIQIKGSGYPHLILGDSDKLEIGEWVIAVGNPFGFTESMTAGIVSAKGRSGMKLADYEDFIQTDAAINPGNSGGPLLDIDGNVVGINTAIWSANGGGYMGIGFAIPVNMAKGIRDQLVKSGKVTRGYLGVYIQDVDQSLAESFGLKDTGGVLISQVGHDSPAEKGGLEQGDVVLKMNGKEVGSSGAFRNEVAAMQPGTVVTFDIVRDGSARDLKLEIGALPGDETFTGKRLTSEVLKKLGLNLQPLTRELADQLGYGDDKGLVVVQVETGSVAWETGIEQGDLIMSLNRRPLESLKDFDQALGQIGKGKALLLLVRNSRSSRYLVLRFDE